MLGRDFARVETLFWNRGYSSRNGNKIAHSTLAGIISNPKYKGYYVGNKVKTVDMFTKKQKFLSPEEWVMFKDETGKLNNGADSCASFAIYEEEIKPLLFEVFRETETDAVEVFS